MKKNMMTSFVNILLDTIPRLEIEIYRKKRQENFPFSLEAKFEDSGKSFRD